MPDYGLTPTGFIPKTIEILREEVNEALRAAFGNSIDVSDGSALGQLVGIFVERIAEVWELGEAVNAAQDPDSATGASLDGLSALTGTRREEAFPSSATLYCTGVAATIITSGSRASVTTTEAEFATTEAGTIAAATAWAITTAYVVGDIRKNSGRIYYCITAGTSAGAGGPTTTSDDITDGTAHWRYVGEGAGYVAIPSECTEDGPTVAASGDIVTIETPIVGWSSVMNLEDADVGADIEADESLRVRREEELAGAGTSPADAIRADLLDLDDVTSVTVFYNDTDDTDADGVPPHAVEALVRGGDDQDILDQLLASVAAGVKTHGTESGTASDDEGTEHDIEFSRPDEIDVYVDLEYTYDADLYPDDGDDQVMAAIVAYGDAQKCGKNVVSSAIIAQVFTVPGVLDVTVCHIGVASNPSATTTIQIAPRELAVYDTSRIDIVATTPATP